METLEGRIQSFIKAKAPSSNKVYTWPHPDSYVATPKTLSEAGFYFNPSKSDPDNVACFLCGKELGGWEDTDDPFEIHVQKCPKCPWVLVRCALESDFDSNGNFHASEGNRNPAHKTLEKARLDTYGGKSKWWPHDSNKKHGATSKKMANAGFVYTPQERGDDTATCFYCDLALSGWDDDDDPLAEHRKRESKSGKPCPFLQAQGGPSSKPASSASHKSARPNGTDSRPPSRISNESDDELTIADIAPKTRRKTANASRRTVDEIASSAQPEAQKPPTKTKASSRKTASRGTRKSSRRPTSDSEEKSEEPLKKPLSRSTRSTRQSKASSTSKGKEKMQASDTTEISEDISNDREPLAIFTETQLSPIVEDKSYHSERITNDVDEQIEEAEAIPILENIPPDPPLESLESLRIPTVEQEHRSVDQPSTPLLAPPALIETNLETEYLEMSEENELGISVPFLAPLAAVPTEIITDLTEEERAMTVEEWIRREMDIQYEQLKRDGERRIEEFKQRASEIRAQIAAL